MATFVIDGKTYTTSGPSAPPPKLASGVAKTPTAARTRYGGKPRASGQARVVLNREALSQLDRVMATGLESLAMRVIQTAKPPDAEKGVGYIGGQRFQRTPGRALADNGGWLAYVDGKRVGGWHEVTRKPRAFKVRGRGVSIAVGFSFPARFQELGTVRQPPRPFLTPAVQAVVGDDAAVYGAMKAAFDGHIAKQGRKLDRAIRSGRLGTGDWRK